MVRLFIITDEWDIPLSKSRVSSPYHQCLNRQNRFTSANSFHMPGNNRIGSREQLIAKTLPGFFDVILDK